MLSPPSKRPKLTPGSPSPSALQVDQVCLSVDSGAGSDDEDEAMRRELEEEEEEEEFAPIPLPPLADIPNLAALEARQSAGLPPDWRQLTGLRRLAIRCHEEIDWRPPLTALSLLTQLRIDSCSLPQESRFPPALCRLPSLKDLTVVGRRWYSRGKLQLELPPSFTELTGLTQLKHANLPLTERSAKLLKDEMPDLRIEYKPLFE